MGPAGRAGQRVGAGARRARGAWAHLVSGDPRLLVLSPAFHGYWRSIERAFSTLGYAVTTLAYDAHPGLGRAGPGQGRRTTSWSGSAAPSARRRAEHTARAVEAVREVDPDVVLVVKGDTFDAAAVGGARGAATRPVALRRAATHRAHAGLARRSRPGGELLPRRRRRPSPRRACGSVHVPLAHDPEVSFTPVPSDEVVFVGARYPGREALLTALAQRGVPVRAHGRDWSGHPLDRLRTWRLRQPARAARPRPRPAPTPTASMAGARGHPQRARRPGRLHDAHLRGLRRRAPCSSSTGPTSSRHYEPGVELAVFGSPEEAAELRPAGRGRPRLGRRACAPPGGHVPSPSTPSSTAPATWRPCGRPDPPPRPDGLAPLAGPPAAVRPPGPADARRAARHRPARRARRLGGADPGRPGPAGAGLPGVAVPLVGAGPARRRCATSTPPTSWSSPPTGSPTCSRRAPGPRRTGYAPELVAQQTGPGSLVLSTGHYLPLGRARPPRHRARAASSPCSTACSPRTPRRWLPAPSCSRGARPMRRSGAPGATTSARWWSGASCSGRRPSRRRPPSTRRPRRSSSASCTAAELPRDVFAEAAETFCRAERATYRPHPSERDRRSVATHARWEASGITIDRSGIPLRELGAPVVSVFSTGVLEAAAAGLPAWVDPRRPARVAARVLGPLRPGAVGRAADGRPAAARGRAARGRRRGRARDDERVRILCVVPARGGSKGVPRKNLRVVGGKPLHRVDRRAGAVGAPRPGRRGLHRRRGDRRRRPRRPGRRCRSCGPPSSPGTPPPPSPWCGTRSRRPGPPTPRPTP